VSQQVEQQMQIGVLGTITIGSVATAFSLAYVLWTTRTAYLVATLLASTPLWKRVDPLPILEFSEAQRKDEEDEFGGTGFGITVFGRA
jgi:hypothetical protein